MTTNDRDFLVEHFERSISRGGDAVLADLQRARDDLARMIADIELGRRIGACEIDNVCNTLRRAESVRATTAATAEVLSAFKPKQR